VHGYGVALIFHIFGGGGLQAKSGPALVEEAWNLSIVGRVNCSPVYVELDIVSLKHMDLAKIP
jgi:hypothetical protein